MADGSPIHRDPLPHFMLFPKNDLDIFSDARFTLMDISNYFTPYALFSFPIMRQNKLISDMVDGKTRSGTSWIPSLELQLPNLVTFSLAFCCPGLK